MVIDMKVVIGGIMMGTAAGIFLLTRGRILGCSGMVFRSLSFSKQNLDIDSLVFILGLFLCGVIYNFMFTVPNPTAVFPTSNYKFIIGGILVGIGTYLGNGCTSGHGLCGMSLLRKRSILAVCLFFPTAIITSWLTH